MHFLREWNSQPWQPVSRGALIAWLVFYSLFLLNLATDDDGFVFLDFANLGIHEAGHLVFSPFGYTLTILGGTLTELLVPLLIAVYFFRQRHLAAVAFCLFWFFENFPYVARYMADARALELPLVGSGDHDWEILFGLWGLLLYDRTIGAWTRMLGWLGMLGTMAWFAWRAHRSPEQPG